jgi:hypothetical protein
VEEGEEAAAAAVGSGARGAVETDAIERERVLLCYATDGDAMSDAGGARKGSSIRSPSGADAASVAIRSCVLAVLSFVD